ncbi:MAG: hypothetical protein LC746_01305 [Acidobacteria bacterium]|nr:hypothetical protein [Acidobacteriota bacterium]
MFKNRVTSLAVSLTFLFALAVVAAAQESNQMAAPKVDKRKLTTIQTASADYGKTKDAVQVRYLNLPWGEATFGYIETGLDPRNNGYYAGRAWPIAHLHLAVPAEWDGQKLAPGDYAFVITPRDAKANKDMAIALESFTPAETGGTFLKAGDVFVETPAGAKVVAQKTVKFDKGAPVAPQLEVWVGKSGKNVDIKFHYGDRTHTERLKLS